MMKKKVEQAVCRLMAVSALLMLSAPFIGSLPYKVRMTAFIMAVPVAWVAATMWQHDSIAGAIVALLVTFVALSGAIGMSLRGFEIGWLMIVTYTSLAILGALAKAVISMVVPRTTEGGP